MGVIKHLITDNTVDQFIPIKVERYTYGFMTKEESWQFGGAEYNYSPALALATLPAYITADTFQETNQVISAGGLYPINGANSATDYIGATATLTQYFVKNEFIDVTYVDTVLGTPLNGLTGDIASAALLHDAAENNKVVTIFDGLQALKIPANKFIDATSAVQNYGKYFIKISAKFIDTPISSINGRSHSAWPINPSDPHGRRTIYTFDNAPFTNSPWQFNDPNFQYQKGRLYGSYVEVWDSSLTTLKTSKICQEFVLDFISGGGSCVLSPDLVGFTAPSEAIGVSDILRFYPRETYFQPVFIELDYSKPPLDIQDVLAYLRNDAVRDLNNGIIEVYDEAGVTIDPAGLPQGNVILTYQLTSDGKKEIRKRITP